MDKKAQTGEGIWMIYKLLLLSAVAFAVFGVSAFYYNYQINIRNAEAVIMTRDISGCLSPNGVLNLDGIPKEDYSKIISYCNIGNPQRFYVGVTVSDSNGKIVKLYQGDSGALWVQKLFKSSVSTGNSIIDGNSVDVKNIEKFAPGYFKSDFPTIIINGGKNVVGDIEIEVLVNYEK